MVVVVESAGMSEIVAVHAEAVERRKKKTARPDARTEFRGVSRLPSGAYSARIWDPSRRAMVWLGSFRDAEEANGAYAAAAAVKLKGERMAAKKKPVMRKDAGGPDAAAVELHVRTPGMAAKKRKKAAGAPDAASVELHVRTPGMVAKKRNKAAGGPDAAAVELHARTPGMAAKKRKKKAAARPDARSEFRGVHRVLNGVRPVQSTARASVMVVAESVGMSEIVAEHVEAVGRRKKKTARPDARTEFRGVSRLPSGRYSARIWDPSRRAMVWLGSFRDAEEAAGAYAAAVKLKGEGVAVKKKPVMKKAAGGPDAAAVELHVRTPGMAAKKRKEASARPDARSEFRGVHRVLNGVRPVQSTASASMMVVAESAGMSEIVAEHVEAVKRRKKKAARPDARTEFRGVSRQSSGTYGARIWDPSLRASVWLGSFGDAEEAAGAYAAAAVKLKGEGVAAKKKPAVMKKAAGRPDAAAVELHACTAAKKRKKPTARPDSRREFRGVHRMPSGKYGAQIRNFKGKAHAWLGTFDAAEDAARAYDAAAVQLHGAWAITNFKQPTAATANGGVSSGQAAGCPTTMVKKAGPRLLLGSWEERAPPRAPGAAAVKLRGVAANPAAPTSDLDKCQSNSWSGFRGVSVSRSGNKLGTLDTAEEGAAGAYDAAAVRLHGEKQPVAAAAAAANGGEEESSMDIQNHFLSDSIVPGSQLDDLWTDLPPAKEQQMVDAADEFINDMDFSDVVV